MIEIFHVSDLHFGKSDLQDRMADSLLAGILRQFPFDEHPHRYLLVTGDVTQKGEEEEYARARQALSPFAGRIFVTPGNHDYGSLLGTDYSEEKARYFDDPFAAALGFTHSFFDKKVFMLPVQEQPGHGALMLLGLNSCAKMGVADFAQGEVGEDQLHELANRLTEGDQQTPRLLFLHHIPNKDAEWKEVMTLRDWPELMAVVKGKVDVLAFGHQGKELEVGFKKTITPEKTRPMRVRSIAAGSIRDGKSDTRKALVLDADGSVAEQAFYRITLDGNKPTASVVPVVPAG